MRQRHLVPPAVRQLFLHFNLLALAGTITGPAQAGGHTWDFSNLTVDFGFYNSTVIAAGAAPSNSRFPGATKAWRTDFVDSWTFFSTPSNEIRQHGSITTYGVKPDTIAIMYDSPSLQYKFPITGNSSWISKHQYTTETNDSNGTLLHTNTYQDSIQWVCDAWGTIKYKTRQVNAIRAKGSRVSRSTTTYPSRPQVVDTTISDQVQFMTVDYNGGGVYLFRSYYPGGEYIGGSEDYRFVQATTPVYENPTATLPPDFTVGQNSPNPFNPETAIDYSIARSDHVRFEVFDILGRTVWQEDFGVQPAGSYRIQWNGRDTRNKALPSGVYLYRISVGKGSEVRKMMLLK